MTKMSAARKVKKGVVGAVEEKVKRNLKPEEVLELQEMLRLINARKFEAAQIKANTALVPDGKNVGDTIEAIARLLENAKNLYVASKLVECGYESGTKCNINLSTGEISLTENGPETSK